MLLITVFFSACGSEMEKDALAPTEPVLETTEPELDPEWVSENAIAEAYACLFPANGGEKDVELAQEILLPLVEAGNAEAQYYWAYIYEWEIDDNDGGEEESRYWHNLAIEQGYAKACLAVLVYGQVESEERAQELLEMAREAGLFKMTPEELGADGCGLVGLYYYFEEEDYNNAIEWFTKAADMGCGFAMHNLGVMYYNGMGVTRNETIFLEWLEKAANLGYGFSMRNLAAYFYSVGDTANAVRWYKKAADVGDAAAMYKMGYFYYSGYGIEKNDAQAQLLFEKSANAGNAASMYWTGWLKLENRYSSEQELNDGMAWCMKAYTNGEDDVAEYINESLKAKRGVNGYFENYGELISVNQ